MPCVLAQSSGIPTPVVAAVIAAVVALLVCLLTNRGNHSRFLCGMVQKIIEFSMTYPYLEDDAFCDQWPHIEDDEKRMRYDNYCCHVFNTLEHVWLHTDGDRAEMKRLIYPDEIIVRHRKWWQGDKENQSGYEEGFCEFVNLILASRSGREVGNGQASDSYRGIRQTGRERVS